MALYDAIKSNPVGSAVLSVPCFRCIIIHNARQMDKERDEGRCGLRDGLTRDSGVGQLAEVRIGDSLS